MPWYSREGERGCVAVERVSDAVERACDDGESDGEMRGKRACNAVESAGGRTCDAGERVSDEDERACHRSERVCACDVGERACDDDEGNSQKFQLS